MSLHRLSRPCSHFLRARRIPVRSCRHNINSRGLATSASSGPLNDTQSSHPPTVDYAQLGHLKRPSRGGQDLAHRYERLERSLRGKSSYGNEIQDLRNTGQVADAVPYTSEEHIQSSGPSARKDTRRIFRGFVVPEAPKPPAEDECCMSGCAICVYDLYDEARSDYIKAVENLRFNLTALGISENEWPADILRDWKGGQTSPVSKPNVTLSAFEQLEQALKAKKAKEMQPISTSHTGDAPERGEAPLAVSVARKRPPKKGAGMSEVYEGLRWVLFSNR